jgi:chromosomal replication initiator protein
VADLYGFTVEEIRGEQRKDKIVRARHHAIWEISKCTPWSLVRIGKLFRKDHTTIINAIRRHQARIDAGTVGP